MEGSCHWPNLRYYPSIRQEGLRKPLKASAGSQFPRQDWANTLKQNMTAPSLPHIICFILFYFMLQNFSN
jgi:hypothetical protein